MQKNCVRDRRRVSFWWRAKIVTVAIVLVAVTSASVYILRRELERRTVEATLRAARGFVAGDLDYVTLSPCVVGRERCVELLREMVRVGAPQHLSLEGCDGADGASVVDDEMMQAIRGVLLS